MPTATLNLISPSGLPVQLELEPGANHEDVIALLERAEKLHAWALGKGWSHPDTQPTTPSAAEMAAGPTFAGYPCSPTVDAAGMPTWILVEGHQAVRREKQGDTWYSYRDAAGEYVQALRIRKGELAPPVVGLPK